MASKPIPSPSSPGILHSGQCCEPGVTHAHTAPQVQHPSTCNLSHTALQVQQPGLVSLPMGKHLELYDTQGPLPIQTIL